MEEYYEQLSKIINEMDQNTEKFSEIEKLKNDVANYDKTLQEVQGKNTPEADIERRNAERGRNNAIDKMTNLRKEKTEALTLTARKIATIKRNVKEEIETRQAEILEVERGYLKDCKDRLNDLVEKQNELKEQGKTDPALDKNIDGAKRNLEFYERRGSNLLKEEKNFKNLFNKLDLSNKSKVQELRDTVNTHMEEKKKAEEKAREEQEKNSTSPEKSEDKSKDDVPTPDLDLSEVEEVEKKAKESIKDKLTAFKITSVRNQATYEYGDYKGSIDLDKCFKNKKEIFKDAKVDELLKDRGIGKINSFFYKRKINPVVLTILTKETNNPEKAQEYLTSILDTKNLPFKLNYDFSKVEHSQEKCFKKLKNLANIEKGMENAVIEAEQEAKDGKTTKGEKKLFRFFKKFREIGKDKVKQIGDGHDQNQIKKDEEKARKEEFAKKIEQMSKEKQTKRLDYDDIQKEKQEQEAREKDARRAKGEENKENEKQSKEEYAKKLEKMSKEKQTRPLDYEEIERRRKENLEKTEHQKFVEKTKVKKTKQQKNENNNQKTQPTREQQPRKERDGEER